MKKRDAIGLKDKIRAAGGQAMMMAAGGEPPMFNEDPDDLVYDPQHGMMLSRQGNAKSARRVPTKDVVVVEEGRTRLATAAKDSIDLMLDKGTINQSSYDAARLFQKEFDRCGYSHYTKTNLSGTGGGGYTPGRVEEIFAGAQSSRDYVHHIITLLGGPTSPMSTVMFWSLGLGHSINKIAEAAGDSKHYWRGIFICGLKLMEQEYLRMQRARQRKTRFSGYDRGK